MTNVTIIKCPWQKSDFFYTNQNPKSEIIFRTKPIKNSQSTTILNFNSSILFASGQRAKRNEHQPRKPIDRIVNYWQSQFACEDSGNCRESNDWIRIPLFMVHIDRSPCVQQEDLLHKQVCFNGFCCSCLYIFFFGKLCIEHLTVWPTCSSPKKLFGLQLEKVFSNTKYTSQSFEGRAETEIFKLLSMEFVK